MLRPDRMSKVSVTGSKRVMTTVIETVHRLHLLHLSDYDGSWEGFDNGDPIEGAEGASERLVTVRALESTLDLDADEADPGGAELDDEWQARLERVRTRVNDLDDRRDEIRDELRRVDEKLEQVKPFAELGIDLDLLSGYDSVEVVVGEGELGEIESAFAAAEEIRAYETFTGGDVVAIVAAPADGAEEGVVDDALVSIEFTRYEVPETEKGPQTYVGELEGRKRDLEGDLDDIDTELDRIGREEDDFLLRVEEILTIEVQRAEAPLQFATTDRAFVAEGWVPTEEYDELVARLEKAVGESVEIEELERADYDRHGAPNRTEAVEHEDDEGEDEEDGEEVPEERPEQKAATDGGTERTADSAGGVVTMDDEPPTVLDNLRPAKPFEMLVNMVSRPNYSELDPTLLVFLTFPIAFGFMIGDIGYGILYLAMGAFLYRFDSDAMRAVGTIALWAGAFTTIFGYLYDDAFGVHMHDLGLHLPLAGSLNKGLHVTDFALLWLVASILFGIVHLNVGFVIGFVNELRHGLRAAVLEKGSWILAMNGLFIWIFSHEDAGSMGLGRDLTGSSAKPDFFVGMESILYSSDYFLDLGFAGLPESVGVLGLVLTLVGIVMVGVGEGIAGLAETPAYLFGHVLSYLRIAAVLLAKGGMAFAVNLLVFGGYEDHGHVYFNLPTVDVTGMEEQFAGLVHIEPLWVTIPIAILVFVFGHILVLLLGITAAGIQMIRLEYVEFFQKFYEGGGKEYEPFGHDRTHTSE